MEMVEGIVLPIVLYGCDAWAPNPVSRKKIEVLEMIAPGNSYKSEMV